MTLIVFLSSRISPRTATVIFFERSPLATAVVTSAILRTWLVRLLAIALTLSVKSFRAPPPPDFRFPAERPFGTHFLGHARHFRRERPQLIDHLVEHVFDLEDLAA